MILRAQRGFTMLEVLISIIVISFGLLGVAGLQAFALKNNQSASLRLAATALAFDMIDRMKSNVEGVQSGHYNKSSVADYTTPVASCLTSAGCTPQQLAQHDLAEWAQRVAAALPDGRGIVCLDSTPQDGGADATDPRCDNTGTTLYAVKIWWVDDRNASGTGASRQLFWTAFNP